MHSVIILEVYIIISLKVSQLMILSNKSLVDTGLQTCRRDRKVYPLVILKLLVYVVLFNKGCFCSMQFLFPIRFQFDIGHLGDDVVQKRTTERMDGKQLSGVQDGPLTDQLEMI